MGMLSLTSLLPDCKREITTNRMILEALGFKPRRVKSVAVMPRLSEDTVPAHDNVPMPVIDENTCVANTTTQRVQQPPAS
jgi:hypothetical protein